MIITIIGERKKNVMLFWDKLAHSRIFLVIIIGPATGSVWKQ